MWLAVALRRVELSDLVICAALAGALEDGTGHAGLDEAGADGVDTHARAR
jgi:hypothetical protein